MADNVLDERHQLSVNWEENREDVTGEERDFPKYTTQLLNLANQNAQGTRPKVVGKMSELINESPDRTYESWKEWYLAHHEDRLEEATDRIEEMVKNMRAAMEEIDREIIREWVEDLVIDKTAEGLIIQEIILQRLAERFGTDYRMADPEEESKNIDGYVGDQPVSIKPEDYRTKKGQTAQHAIDVPVIYYKKTQKYLHIYVDDEELDV